MEIYDSEYEGNHFEDPGINICDSCMDIIYYRESSREADTIEKAVIEWYKNRQGCISKEPKND